MAKKNPKKISRPEPFLLKAEWTDGKETIMPLEIFRKECPCAYCKGETVGNKILSEPIEVKDEPGAFDLVDMKPIGNYAVAVKWKNGHDTGIYTWEYFKEIMEKNDIKDDEEKIDHYREKHKVRSKKIRLDVL